MENVQTWNTTFQMGSMSKPPTLIREEYPQWKVRMINFLNGHDQRLYSSIVSGPHVPMTEIRAVPASGDTPEILASKVPTDKKIWNQDDRGLMSIDERAKSLLIMAIPNAIFSHVDAYATAKEI